MAFELSKFRSLMQFDGARPNLFECKLAFPAYANIGSPGEKFTFMARAASLPGSTVNSVPVMYFGREFKFAGNRVFQDWAVTIINDEDFLIRNAFERWLNGLNEHTTGLRNNSFISPSDYQSGDESGDVASVIQYGKNGDRIKQYYFFGMFPVDITPIDLDWGSNDNIEEYTVTFAYQWWTESESVVS